MVMEIWGDDAPYRASTSPRMEQKAEEKPAFDIVDEHLRRNTADADIWKKSTAEYARIMTTLAPAKTVAQAIKDLDEKDDRETKCREALQAARSFISTMPTGSWPTLRTYMAYGAMDTQDLVVLCEYKILSWQTAIDAKAMHGTGEDMQAIAGAAKLAGQSLNFANALTYAAMPRLMTTGLFYDGNLSTTEALFDLGATPNTDNTSLFIKVVENGNMDIARAFAKRAHTVNLSIEKYVNWAQSNNKPQMYECFRKLQWEYGRYNAVDYETLVETKPLPENAQLNIVFNFAARRVSEIYTYSNPRQSVKTDFNFEDYAEDAIMAAQKKLVEMGGKPTPYDGSTPTKRSIAKPKLSVSP